MTRMSTHPRMWTLTGSTVGSEARDQDPQVIRATTDKGNEHAGVGIGQAGGLQGDDDDDGDLNAVAVAPRARRARALSSSRSRTGKSPPRSSKKNRVRTAMTIMKTWIGRD